ncbi:flagellar basal body L-ring protein FlgH [Paracoccus sp. p3-h83]|uniref:flagellar basal body L-ring protein FlgH n=1 Tax=Paracoccus sp. p3-h83 TaxID=3342805 RepID=UPI0035B84329
MRLTPFLMILLALPACQRLQSVGDTPGMTPVETGRDYVAMAVPQPLPGDAPDADPASLWTGAQASLLGDRRAAQRGDILTVVVEIDERAEMSNTSGRNRSGSESMGIPSMLGIPQRIASELPAGASLNPAVKTNSASTFKGNGSTSRREKLELRVAATVTEVMPNGVLRIEGSQEVRVNFEVRELLVTGFVRPNDISRQNEVTYDKIAGARISYGGRGQITDVQQPRLGQQVADIVLPF